MNKRTSGILLHITSLPGGYGIGDMGPAAYRFADFLVRGRQSHWQILPLNPPHSMTNITPYNCLSAFAGNLYLISPDKLVESGYLKKTDITGASNFDQGVLDYKMAGIYRRKLFDKVLAGFQIVGDKSKYNQFCGENNDWLADYALFMALSDRFGTTDWSLWPKAIRDRQPAALKAAAKEMKDECEREMVRQFLFFEQWFAVKQYCNDHGISIIGDMPIYVAYQSADVWAHQEIFKLDQQRRPQFISGVPPDAFSRTGQLWGNPVYDWAALRKRGYDWWVMRMRQNLTLYDMVRIDHFRGLVQYWQVPAEDRVATHGKWVDGPGADLFRTLNKYFPAAPIIAEDLGYITPDVRELAAELGLPGMKVLLFAFDDVTGQNAYLPHHHVENAVVYTGTHDNNTVRGWFEKEATSKQKKALFAYLGRQLATGDLPREFVRMAMQSVALTTIIPMQDLLGLGNEARMNHPAKKRGNWRWRLKTGQVINNTVADELGKLTQLYGRG